MANTPIYPAEGSVLDNVRDFIDTNNRNTERIHRALLGLHPSAPLPKNPEGMKFPAMVYKPDYYSTTDRIEQGQHYRMVRSEQEQASALDEGFFASAVEARAEFDKRHKKDKK